MIDKVRKALNEGGLRTVSVRGIRFTYRKIMKYLPQRYGNYNGVITPSHKLLGTVLNNEIKNKPNYEEALVKGLEETVEEGDVVNIIGGGLGVTSVKAAQKCGSSGKVRVYEASDVQKSKVEDCLRKNNIENVEVFHKLVGEKVDVWNDNNEAKTLKPANLPDSEILEMDIEGSEISVLKGIRYRPRSIIVESHGNKGAPTEEVKSLLKDMNYKIEWVRPAEPREFFKTEDIRVIMATHNSN